MHTINLNKEILKLLGLILHQTNQIPLEMISFPQIPKNLPIEINSLSKYKSRKYNINKLEIVSIENN